MIRIDYDKADPVSIETYAKNLLGMSFRDVIEADELSADGAENKKNKGNLGQIIEEHYFHYKINSDADPDFKEAGVELKVSPIKEKNDGSLAAKERLILTMINYNEIVKETFETGHFWKKSKLILLIFYLYKKDINQTLDYKIKYASLFTPPEQDFLIIRSDYDKILSKINAGKAHELSEGDTLYLGAAPKAANASVRRSQPFSNIPAKPRAFCYKNSYMTYVLNKYIVKAKTTYEPIIKDEPVSSFEDYVIEKIAAYRGWSIEDLCVEFNLDQAKNPKNLEALLTYRILGIKGNQAEEFIKADIVVKTIRIGKNGKIKENMSFPAFKFKELVEETWETSTFGNYLRETRFFFVVYKFDENDVLRLAGCLFWNMPYEDLEKDVRSVWEKAVKVLKDGLKVEEKDGRNFNNFPKQTENRVSHIRPHARNAADTYELPDGRQYPKQCFWLNNSYILEQIKDKI